MITILANQNTLDIYHADLRYDDVVTNYLKNDNNVLYKLIKAFILYLVFQLE